MAENAHRFFYAVSGPFLSGLSGLAGIFITSIYTGVEKYKSCIFPHPYIGSLENRCQPVNPSRLGWIGGLAVLKCKCVLPETQGRLDSNASSFELEDKYVLLEAQVRFFGCCMRGEVY